MIKLHRRNYNLILDLHCQRYFCSKNNIEIAAFWVFYDRLEKHDFDSLPNHKVLDQSKLKAFACDKINAPQNLKLVLESKENIVGKGENTCNQHFLLFPQCFQKFSLLAIVW